VEEKKVFEHPLKLKISELLAHLPITILATLLSYYVLKKNMADPTYIPNFPLYFHIFIFLHFFMSASTTTAVYFKHTTKITKAMLVGISGSAITCSVADILLPYLGIYFIGLKIKMHFCLIEEPISFVFILFGSFMGFLLFRFFVFITYITHPLHILSSVLAAYFYLVSYGKFELQPISIIIVIFSVLLPCTFSDFVYPMLFVHKSCCMKKYI
jgi:hypothetical protein